MLLQTFYENEVVQILDPATSIWESAKIICFVSDWCVRIKWVDWSYNKKEDITVPEVYRPDKNYWNIRKSHNLVREETVSNKRRSTPLSYNARRLVRNDQIYFWQPECNCVDSERCQEDSCCGSVVMGWVKINDPFCQQCLITDVEDNDEYVSYRQLRDKPCVRDTEPEIDETEQDHESGSDVHRPFVKKQARVTSATQPMPQVDLLPLLPSVDDDVELTYAPCENDIIKVMFSCFFAYKLCF